MAFSTRLARSKSVQRSLVCAAGVLGVYLSDENEQREGAVGLPAANSTALSIPRPSWVLRSTDCDAEAHPPTAPAANKAKAIPRPSWVLTKTDCDAEAPPTAPSSRMSLEPRLEGKVAIITGASRGFGQAIAVKFVEQGCKVVLLDVLDCNETLAKIEAIDSMVQSLSNVAIYIHCDISNEDQVKEAIEVAVQHFDGPKIDVLVNNACAFVFKSVEDASVADWRQSMDVNILGHALVTKYCLPYMKLAAHQTPGFGPSIIFQGSISSFRGQPNCATYATMKGAIVQLARNCAYDLAKYNIRCNSICAGTIETPISQQVRPEKGRFTLPICTGL